MNYSILFNNLKHLSQALLFFIVASLFWTCAGTSDNREVELSRKETELAKKETELKRKELEMMKGETLNQISNSVSPTPSRTTSPSKVKGGKTIRRADCDSGHWIESVSGDGTIIKLEDNSVWEVDAVDAITSTLWLPITDVLVCEDKIINIDDNESVSVTRLR